MIQESIKEKEFASTLLHYDLTGFIAECHLPHHSKFMFCDGEEQILGVHQFSAEL